MPKIKFDLSQEDFENAQTSANFEPPKPGVYPATVKECNATFAKGDDGKPDRKRPMLEVILSVTGDRYKGAQLWEYVTFSETTKWKYAQFLLAFGLGGDDKTSGEFDTAKVVGKACQVRVKAGKNQSGDYRAEVGALLPPGGSDGEVVGDGETIDEGDFTDMGGSGDDGIVDDEAGTGEEDEWDARRAELMAKQVAELKDDAKAVEVAYSGKKKAEVVDAIIEAEQARAAEPEDDIVEDEEIIEDEPSADLLTEEQLMAMEIPELKDAAKQFDVPVGGQKRKDVVAAILAKQAEGGDEFVF